MKVLSAIINRLFLDGFRPVSPDAAWKSCLAVELFNTKNGNNDIMGFTNEEIDELFKFACTE